MTSENGLMNQKIVSNLAQPRRGRSFQIRFSCHAWSGLDTDLHKSYRWCWDQITCQFLMTLQPQRSEALAAVGRESLENWIQSQAWPNRRELANENNKSNLTYGQAGTRSCYPTSRDVVPAPYGPAFLSLISCPSFSLESIFHCKPILNDE